MSTAKPLFVQILPEPVKSGSSKRCSYEWNTFGNCCVESDLDKFFELEVELMSINNKNLKAEVKNRLDRLGKQLEILKTGTDQKKVSDLKSSVEKIKKDFGSQSDRCINHIEKVRGNALCSICSGRSEKYFHGDKMLIAPQACFSLVESCGQMFMMLTSIKAILKQMEGIFSQTKAERSSLEDLVYLKHSLSFFSPPQELVKGFEQLFEKKADSQEQIKDSLEICSMVMNVRKLPYFMSDHPEIRAKVYAKVSHQADTVLNKEQTEAVKQKIPLLDQARKEFLEKLNSISNKYLVKGKEEEIRHNMAIEQENSRHGLVLNQIQESKTKHKQLEAEEAILYEKNQKANSLIKNLDAENQEKSRHNLVLNKIQEMKQKIKEEESKEESLYKDNLRKEKEANLNVKRSFERSAETEKKEADNQYHAKLAEISKTEETLRQQAVQKKEDSKTEQNKEEIKKSNNWNEIQASIQQEITKTVTSNSRLLSSTDLPSNLQPETPLVSDSLVLISASDSMFTSFIGTKGTFPDPGSGSVLPLNMSLIFP